MDIPFLDRWRRRQDPDGRVAMFPDEEEGEYAELFAECELLRSLADREGIRLDDTPASLEALDQVKPRWRDDEEVEPWLGNDAGFYLGTVVVRTVPGSGWRIVADGQPVVRLASGREVDVLTDGRAWAASGAPELYQVYAEIAEA